MDQNRRSVKDLKSLFDGNNAQVKNQKTCERKAVESGREDEEEAKSAAEEPFRPRTFGQVPGIFRDALSYLDGQGDGRNRDDHVGNVAVEGEAERNLVIRINFSRTVKFMIFFLTMNTLVLCKVLLWERLERFFLSMCFF